MSEIVAKLYDLASNELADISSVMLDKSLTPAHNGARQFQFTVPTRSVVREFAVVDGYRNLRRGNRKLVVWENGTPIFHGRVWSIERTGDANQITAAVTCYDPFMELGFAADDRAGRPVRDATGNLISPSFPAPVSGPGLIYQVLTNSQGNVDTIGDPNLHEGPLPIDLTLGTFDTSVPPAIDLSCVDTMDWPALIGDFMAQLADTDVCDFFMRPLDIGEAADPYKMVALSAVSSYGTDKSATVHFDYWTGSRNASGVRVIEDFSTICNKLYDFLGPRMDDNLHWKGSLTPGSPGVTVDPTASRALYGGPGVDKGEFMWIRPYDTLGVENDSRPLYTALYNSEAGWRVEPRNLLYITPSKDTKALFQAPQAFDIGDQITINLGDDVGHDAISDKQRVYGYTKTWSRENVASLSELVTSADV